jgi:hypothetical protein
MPGRFVLSSAHLRHYTKTSWRLSAGKVLAATLEWEMQDIERSGTVLFTAVTGSTLSLIEVWNGLGHTFTEDGLAARA